MANLFVCAPITQISDPKTQVMDPQFRTWLTPFLDRLKADGHEVVCAHEREKWGESPYPPPRALIADLDAIKAADAIVAFIGDPVSPGVQMEIGYALSFPKPVVWIEQPGSKVPYLMEGLDAATRTVRLPFREEDGFKDTIAVAVKGLLNR